jgi:catechol 2,3-dioxygenase-like lactoylglutathione lyase family enzyme
MKLNHLSFPSSDVPATTDFFVKYLGFTLSAQVAGACVLKYPGFDVVIDKADSYTPDWPKNFHIGFELPSVEAVQELYARFKDEGVDMESGVFNNDRGSRFFCRAPGGIMFEINTRVDALAQYQGTFDN